MSDDPQGLIEIQGGSPDGMVTIGWADTYAEARKIAARHLKRTRLAVEIRWHGEGDWPDDFVEAFRGTVSA